MLKDRRVLTILIIQITEVLGFSLILPFLPFMATDFGASPFTIGLILTSFSLFQFISSPIMGALSDRFGRRPLLIISQLSTMLSFIVLAFANSLPLIFLSRIIDGAFGSNQTITQAYLSDISTKKNRTKMFSFIGIAFGFGFMIGPAIGGILSKNGYLIPSLLAAFMVGISIVLTYFFLPETVVKNSNTDLKIKIVNLSRFKTFFSQSTTASLLTIFFLYIFAHVTWTSVFSVFAKNRFGFTTVEAGYALASLGLFTVISRAFVVPKLIDGIGDYYLVLLGSLFMFISLFSSSFVTTGLQFLPFMFLFSLGTGATRPTIMSSISRSANKGQSGALLGVSNSLSSIAQIIGPALGGFLLTKSYTLFNLFTSIFMFAVFLILLRPSVRSIFVTN